MSSNLSPPFDMMTRTFNLRRKSWIILIVAICCLHFSSGLMPTLDGLSRRGLFQIAGLAGLTALGPPSLAEESPVEVAASGDAKKLFNEARALESQGNMAAAQRLYSKVTKISPRFIYGWSNLANTEVAFGDLSSAEENYSKAIQLCQESRVGVEAQFGVKKCNDLYVLLLNRGTVRLNNGQAEEALKDLQQASILRERPDAIVLQNLARAKELNGLYSQADKDYNLAISMSSNEVNPFWLRSSLVKYQLGDTQGGFDLLKRVENRFPEAPEVRAAYATYLAAKGDDVAARRKFLEIPDRQRLKYTDMEYLTKVISWPPSMIDGVVKIGTAVGDKKI